jgi:hypothetical protein
MTKDEALKMAIEVLDLNVDCVSESKWKEAINACKEALEPEPMTTTDVITCKMTGKCCMTGEALEQPLTRDWKHTIEERIARDIEFKEALEQPAWQGLTDDEIHNIADYSFPFPSEMFDEIFAFARAIEQALKDKNT